MKVRIKKLNEHAVIPCYATDGSAGMDLTAVSKTTDEYGNIVYGTGLSFELPKGYVGLLFPRSSNSKTQLLLMNHVGVLDSDYRGEVTFKFRPLYHKVHNAFWFQIAKKLFGRKGELCAETWELDSDYEVGDRIGQIIIVKHPNIEFVESEELSETERGKGGYGSTGR